MSFDSNTASSSQGMKAASVTSAQWRELLSSQVLPNLERRYLNLSVPGSSGGGGGSKNPRDQMLAYLAAMNRPTARANYLSNFSIFHKIPNALRKQLIDSASQSSAPIDRAIGSVVGMGLGDAFGAPLEFLSILDCAMLVPQDPEESQHSQHLDQAEFSAEDGVLDPSKPHFRVVPRKQKTQQKKTSKMTWSAMASKGASKLGRHGAHKSQDKSDEAAGAAEAKEEEQEQEYELQYLYEKNTFGLRRGQWTDDASMGLCMGDSLVINNFFDGSDIRIRFWNWWNNGYCNAFGNDRDRGSRFGPHLRPGSGQGSVGLGGNISQSLHSLEQNCYPTSVFEVDHDREDSGNGSIMRLAPVPVFFHNDVELARKYSALSSFTTHPGHIAAECCALMSFIIVRAVHAPEASAVTSGSSGSSGSSAVSAGTSATTSATTTSTTSAASGDEANNLRKDNVGAGRTVLAQMELTQEERTRLQTMVPKEDVKTWLELVTREYYCILEREIETLHAQLSQHDTNALHAETSHANDTNDTHDTMESKDAMDAMDTMDTTDDTKNAQNMELEDFDVEMDVNAKGTASEVSEVSEVAEEAKLKNKLLRRQINAKKLMQQLINCGRMEGVAPESSLREMNWNWKLGVERYKQQMMFAYHVRRGDSRVRDEQGRERWVRGNDKYNGYPVSPGYWGSYCMDGMAMGLHGVYNSVNFAHAIRICANLLGDADSTASIGGQMAGSIYGYLSLFEKVNDKDGGREMVRALNRWDDDSFALRGLLLYVMGEQYREDAQQLEAMEAKKKENEERFYKSLGGKGKGRQ